jgi:hypothetical protein
VWTGKVGSRAGIAVAESSIPSRSSIEKGGVFVITIHLANTAERHRADALVRRVYTVQGFGDHGLHELGDTFIVRSGRHMIGTLSLVVDGPDGLPSDGIFRTELSRLRAAGARLCELTRFAIDTQAPSARIFNDLFGEIHRHGIKTYDCTDLVIQADPRHGCFYRRRLGFKPLGPVVNNPYYDLTVQLMRIHVSELTRRFEPAQGIAPERHGLLLRAG